MKIVINIEEKSDKKYLCMKSDSFEEECNELHFDTIPYRTHANAELKDVIRDIKIADQISTLPYARRQILKHLIKEMMYILSTIWTPSRLESAEVTIDDVSNPAIPYVLVTVSNVKLMSESHTTIMDEKVKVPKSPTVLAKRLITLNNTLLYNELPEIYNIQALIYVSSVLYFVVKDLESFEKVKL